MEYRIALHIEHRREPYSKKKKILSRGCFRFRRGFCFAGAFSSTNANTEAESSGGFAPDGGMSAWGVVDALQCRNARILASGALVIFL